MANGQNVEERIAIALERIAAALEDTGTTSSPSIGAIFAKADDTILQFAQDEQGEEARALLGLMQLRLQEDGHMKPGVASDLTKLYTPRSFIQWIDSGIHGFLLEGILDLEHHENSLSAAMNIVDALEAAGLWEE